MFLGHFKLLGTYPKAGI